MPLEFEAAKGISEKLFNVRFPVLMRVLLPGGLLVGVLCNLVGWFFKLLPQGFNGAWQKLAVIALCIFVAGALIAAVSNEIYKIYEGRIFWPRRLEKWGVNRQARRIKKLRRLADHAFSRSDFNRYNELWYRLRSYPIDDNSGEPEAARPTMLGNILAGYEQYPDNRYGMDSVFYWPRIWLQVEKEKKEEIDSQWSVADGFLSLSAISVTGGILWIVQASLVLSDFLEFAMPLGSAEWCALAGVGWLILGYGFYRLSLPFHRENGELFKSIFDLYRKKVWSMTGLKPNEKEMWDAAWGYLQYYRLTCPVCGVQNVRRDDKCKNCGQDMKELSESLRTTGKFPTHPY